MPPETATEATFAGLRLLTLPGRVMTPRAASEQLVAATRARIGEAQARVADVGTGSGALAVAIALSCPRAEVWATDTSASAALLACANAVRLEVAERVHVRRGDLLEPAPGRFDAIVANLPYVPAAAASEYPDLAAEPFDAVFGGGDGLDAYRRLVDVAADRLTSDGFLLLQLDRRLVACAGDELPALRAALAAPRGSARERWVHELACAA